MEPEKPERILRADGVTPLLWLPERLLWLVEVPSVSCLRVRAPFNERPC